MREPQRALHKQDLEGTPLWRGGPASTPSSPRHTSEGPRFPCWPGKHSCPWGWLNHSARPVLCTFISESTHYSHLTV